MKVSDFIASFLESKQIEYIFGYMGGMITHLADSIDKNPYTKFIQVYHEQSAAFAAEGYARETNRVGVAISTSGPGATNMVTGIANAYFDSIPVIYLTGQVNTQDYKYELPIRQQGFQETDIVSIVSPITKYAVLVDEAKNIKYELEKAYYLATTHKKGPVLLDIPLNIQREEIEIDELIGFEPTAQVMSDSSFDLESIVSMIHQAKRPLILAGAGVMEPDTKEVFRTFIHQTKLPVIYSLMAKGCLDDDLPETVGMIGSYGNRCANLLVPESDLLIVLGSRLDNRQTGNLLAHFHPNGPVIHVNVDQHDLDYHRLNNRVKVHQSVDEFLTTLHPLLTDFSISNEWQEKVTYYQQAFSQEQEIKHYVKNKLPYQWIDILNQYANQKSSFTVDIGQNQMWSAQYLTMHTDQNFYTSGGLAPMGYAIPAAVGVAFANLTRQVYVICGDGGFQMSLQSLMLISQYDLPILVIVFNNRSLGMITQFQSLYFNGRYTGTTEAGGYQVPDIESLAKAYSLPYFKALPSQLDDSEYLASVFKARNGIVELVIEGETTVCPKLEYNRPINEPSPYVKKGEIE